MNQIANKFAATTADIRLLIKTIQSKLKTLDKQGELSWPRVGSAQKVRTDLLNTAAFLMNVDPDVAEAQLFGTGERQKDKYDEAVDFLTANPDKINDAWNDPRTVEGGCLFQVAGNQPNFTSNHGCLTQIRSEPTIYKAQTPELTAEILADDRLPNQQGGQDITVKHLPVFAEWMRRLATDPATAPYIK